MGRLSTRLWKPTDQTNHCIPWEKLNALSEHEKSLVKETISIAAHNENIRQAQHRFIKPDVVPELDVVDSIAVIAFDARENLLALKKKSRLALPTGRVEWDDDNTEAAARREVLETTGLTLGPLFISSVIENTKRNEHAGSSIIFTGYVNEESVTPESNSQFLNEETFLSRCTGGVSTHRRLIQAAKDCLNATCIKGKKHETIRYNLRSKA